MSNQLQLCEMGQDLLLEMFNLGVGRAAHSLSKMVRQEVLLSVPQAVFLNIAQLAREYSGQFCGVTLKMEGPFTAQAVLLFPEDCSLHIIHLMMGEHLPEEMLSELQPEAYAEIGNIVMNACIGSIAQMLEASFEIGLPQFQRGSLSDLLKIPPADHPEAPHQENQVMLVHIDMRLKSAEFGGSLTFLLVTCSMEQLQAELKRVLEGLL